MTLVLYTFEKLNNTFPFFPTETIFITKSNFSILKELNIQTLPAVIKTVAGRVTKFEGQELENVTSLTTKEQAEDLQSKRS